MPATEPLHELDLPGVGGRVRFGALGRLGWLVLCPEHAPAVSFTEDLPWLCARLDQLAAEPLKLRAAAAALDVRVDGFFAMALATVSSPTGQVTVGLEPGELERLRSHAVRLMGDCVPGSAAGLMS